MKTNKQSVGSVKNNIVKRTQFVLKTPPALPVKGLHSAVIGEVTNETGIENDVEINRIRVPISLAEKDAKGNNYVLDRLYNIGESGRGLNALCQDYLAWSGIEVAKDELYSFDCNAAMKDKPVVVDVGYHVNGTKVTAVIKSFHPAGYTGPVPEVGA